MTPTPRDALIEMHWRTATATRAMSRQYVDALDAYLEETSWVPKPLNATDREDLARESARHREAAFAAIEESRLCACGHSVVAHSFVTPRPCSACVCRAYTPTTAKPKALEEKVAPTVDLVDLGAIGMEVFPKEREGVRADGPLRSAADFEREERERAYEWRIERDPEDGLTYITHARWSLVGQGATLDEAARDLAADAPGVFAAYVGRDDLSGEGARMVAWLRDTFGLRAAGQP